jgi:putative DNA primase/helicase
MGTYADRINSDIFLQSNQVNGNAATPEKAKLKGLRLVLASETPEDGRLNENEIKGITGGDDITARRLHRDPMTFRPTHKIVILTNYKPHTSNDTAVWDRMKLVEFRERFDGERRDPRLKDTLMEEADGILEWLVEGARLFYAANGVGHIPTPVRHATEEYRSSENLIESWMKERTRTDPAAKCTAKELFEDFRLWMSAETDKTISQQKFGRQLSRMGVPEVKCHGSRFRQGVSLIFSQEIAPWPDRGAD